MDPCSRLIPALDKMDLDAALRLMSLLPKAIPMAKVNDLADDRLKEVLDALRLNNCPNIWVDWKLHDTPDTIGARAKRIKKAGGHAVTAHASGGAKMVKAAKDSGLYVIGVTLLTSLGPKDIERAFPGALADSLVKAWAIEAFVGGADALVCSSTQIANLHHWRSNYAACDSWNMKLIVPGTRSAGADTNDQQQVDTPHNAILNGADYLVVGRQVTENANPAAALQAIADEIAPAIEARMEAGTWRS